MFSAVWSLRVSFVGCKTLADVARVTIDRHEMSVGFSVNTTSTEYGDGLCECMLSRPHTHYLITPNGVVEYLFRAGIEVIYMSHFSNHAHFGQSGSVQSAYQLGKFAGARDCA